MNKNPFSSKTFTTTWVEHFRSLTQILTFHFINGISFFKHPFLPLYTNVGRYMTKGIYYILKEPQSDNFGKKVFLIYDIPVYFEINTKIENKNLKLHRVKQYPGFLIRFQNYSGFENYLSSVFSKNSRQKLNRYKKRLELCFDISYKIYYGNISKEEYDVIFRSFHTLLTKRFQDKQIANNNLDPKEWNFYYEVVYPLILEKKASLYVIYNRETPISVRLNYYSDETIFDAITVFDIDYNKFHLGKVSIMKMLEWAFEKNYAVFDFSKGYYDYKESWSDFKYDFEYHIYYNSNSLASFTLSKLLQLFYKGKQYLREKNINEHLHRLTYMLDNKASKPLPKFTVNDITEELMKENTEIEKICIDQHSYLKQIVFEFLFLNSESQKDVALFISKNQPNTYYIIGDKYKKQIIISK
ncbi:GNAT family N-acetyltransferase [Arenibacter sp. F26102]|uniref:GNAT family N-acetyltransferase n=1 Tax=Arenibacter sp. F26102 TaxID=2926416 RepID=UPI001FF3C3F7|nr:GNAT family N-acetyltransferase [Arenibacter sp. F26102]MCK0147062.1 GNAT family N-acetyltransferase [Arenibacter sp. F26102]